MSLELELVLDVIEPLVVSVVELVLIEPVVFVVVRRRLPRRFPVVVPVVFWPDMLPLVLLPVLSYDDPDVEPVFDVVAFVVVCDWSFVVDEVVEPIDAVLSTVLLALVPLVPLIFVVLLLLVVLVVKFELPGVLVVEL